MPGKAFSDQMAQKADTLFEVSVAIDTARNILLLLEMMLS